MREPKPCRLPPIDTWLLISDGIEGPLTAGFRRALKHTDSDITDHEIERITNVQRDYLMNWFADTFIFDDSDFHDATPE